MVLTFSTSFRRPLMAAAAAFFLACGVSQADAASIETSAKYAYIIDFTTGAVLLDKNAEELMPPSSMSKLMTAYVVFEALRDGRLKLTDELPVSENAWRKQGSKMFVRVGDRVKVDDLLHGVIIDSGNDACIVLAEGLANSESAFAEQLNARSRVLGLTKSTFRNATGWPDPGHLMTPHDLAVLARHIITDFPEYYLYYSKLNFTYNGITQGNRNPLLYKNIGADGLKTGHTEIAGYGLTASVKRGDRRIIMVLNGLSSMKERSEESERLAEWAFREFDNFPLFEANEVVADADVWLGSSDKVPLVAKEKTLVTMPHSARKDMKVSMVYDGPIPAPIKKGDVVGKLVMTAPGMAPMETPLIAGADVDRLGFFGRVVAAAKHLILGS